MSLDFPAIHFFETHDCLIVPIRQEIYDDFLRYLQKSICEKVKESACHGVILDVSSANIIDSSNFNTLIQLSKMTALLGKEMVVVGLQASVASALTELPGLELNKMKNFIDLNMAMNYLNKKNELQNVRKQ